MKNGNSNLRIHRTSTSPYFPADFNKREQKTLESLAPGIELTTGLPAEILITNTHTNFYQLSPMDLLKIELIIHPNSGYDNFNAELVRSLNIPIVLGNTIRAEAVTTYILSALFAHQSRVIHQPHWHKERSFNRKLLNEQKVTIIGYGHIGKLLEKTLKPLCRELVIIDPFENKTGDSTGSNVLILACGYNFSNHHMINQKFISSLAHDVLIINTARGELIDTFALVDFLIAHKSAHAVLDVFEQEPNDFSIFAGLSNITLTSHIAGVYNGIDQATIDFECKVIGDFLRMEDHDFRTTYSSELLNNRLREEGLI